MYFNEDDIDFSKIEDFKKFEEICFDLLYKIGYHSLVWRQGGSDNGRDIEAYFTLSNPLVGPYTEKWYIECKYYTGGVPVDEISSKFDWAEVERAQHLVIITSSYLTTATRTWIEKRMERATFRLHVLEGKALIKLFEYQVVSARSLNTNICLI
jgi:hypothetical protein